jgi:hypothetical protein
MWVLSVSTFSLKTRVAHLGERIAMWVLSVSTFSLKTRVAHLGERITMWALWAHLGESHVGTVSVDFFS